MPDENPKPKPEPEEIEVLTVGQCIGFVEDCPEKLPDTDSFLKIAVADEFTILGCRFYARVDNTVVNLGSREPGEGVGTV